jgi:hypothetical protein
VFGHRRFFVLKKMVGSFRLLYPDIYGMFGSSDVDLVAGTTHLDPALR